MLSLLHSGDGWNRMMNWMRDPELARDHELADEAKRHGGRLHPGPIEAGRAVSTRRRSSGRPSNTASRLLPSVRRSTS